LLTHYQVNHDPFLLTEPDCRTGR